MAVGVVGVARRDRRRRDVVAAPPQRHLLFAELGHGLLLVLAGQVTVVALVQPPRAADGQPQPAHDVEGQVGRPDRPDLERGVHDRRQQPGLGQDLAGPPGLLFPERRQVGVHPTGEAVLPVPLAFPVPEEDQRRRHPRSLVITRRRVQPSRRPSCPDCPGGGPGRRRRPAGCRPRPNSVVRHWVAVTGCPGRGPGGGRSLSGRRGGVGAGAGGRIRHAALVAFVEAPAEGACPAVHARYPQMRGPGILHWRLPDPSMPVIRSSGEPLTTAMRCDAS